MRWGDLFVESSSILTTESSYRAVQEANQRLMKSFVVAKNLSTPVQLVYHLHFDSVCT
jgi:hypothetical protein